MQWLMLHTHQFGAHIRCLKHFICRGWAYGTTSNPLPSPLLDRPSNVIAEVGCGEQQLDLLQGPRGRAPYLTAAFGRGRSWSFDRNKTSCTIVATTDLLSGLPMLQATFLALLLSLAYEWGQLEQPSCCYALKGLIISLERMK